MSVFYDHLIQVDSVRSDLAAYLQEEAEIQEVLAELDASLHHVVLGVILQELPPRLHEPFLIRFKQNPADPDHLVFLRQYAPSIEESIRAASDKSKMRFLDAIHE